MAEELNDDDLLQDSMILPIDLDELPPVEDIDYEYTPPELDEGRTEVSQFGDLIPGRLPAESELILPPADAEQFILDASSYIRDGLDSQGKSEEEINKEIDRILKDQGITVDNLKYVVREQADRMDDPETLSVSLGRLLGGRREVSITPESFQGLTAAEKRIAETRKESEKYQALIDDFVDSLFSLDLGRAKETGSKLIRPIYEGSEPIRKEEIVASGVDKQFKGLLGTIGDVDWFGRSPEDKDSEFFIPYIFKMPFTDAPDVAERIGEHVGVGNLFAPMFVEPGNLEDYKKDNRLVLPRESYEPMVTKYEQLIDQGMTKDEIKLVAGEEFFKMLSVASYDDMPAGTQLDKPNIGVFKDTVSANPDFFNQFNLPLMEEAVKTVTLSGSDAKLQKILNRLPFGALPPSVWAGTIPSPETLIETVLDDIERVVDAKGEAGKTTRKFMSKLEQSMLEEVDINGEVYVVESTFGKLMRFIGVAQELFLEAGLPSTLPLLPGNSEFHANYNLRSPEVGMFARVLANVNTGNVGAQVHLTNETLRRGFKKGDAEYQYAATVGALLDFLVPWEMMALKPVTVPTKAVYRGSRLARQFDMKGGWSNPNKWKVFYAGATPALYDYVENVAVNVDYSVRTLRAMGNGQVTPQTLSKILQDDRAVATAFANGTDIPVDEFGNQLPRLGYTARRVAEELKKGFNEGLSFEESFNKIKREYKPDVFETVFHASQTFLYHTAHTQEGAKLFKRSGAEEGGILPFQVEQQVARALDGAGFNPSEVKRRALAHAQENAARYLRHMRSAYVLGDLETIELRMSPAYRSAARKVDDLVNEGFLSAKQKEVLMAVLQNRSIHAANDSVFKAYKNPEDFFDKFKIKKSTFTSDDATAARTDIRFQVGDIFDMSQSSLDNLVEIFQKGEFDRLLKNDAETLIDIMGGSWSNTFFGNVGSQANKAPNAKIAKKLSRDGANKVEHMLRAIISGTGEITETAQSAADLYHNLQAMYARFRGEANGVVPDLIVRGKIDNFLRPDLWFRNDLVGMNMRKFARSDQQVTVENAASARIGQERQRKTGQKRFFDVDTHSDYVRQGLGLNDDVKKADALRLYTDAIAYVIAEDFKRRESGSALGGMDLVKLGGATVASKSTAESIRKRVNSRMAVTLGIQNRKKLSNQTYLDAKKLIEIADGENQILSLNRGQQARFSVLIARMQSEPFIGRKIPPRLTGVDADFSKISFNDYNKVIELMLDLEGSPVSRSSLYTDKIPKSLGYALFRSLKNSTLNFTDQIPAVREALLWMDSNFNLKSPMDDTVRPELRNIVRASYKRTQNIRAEVSELIRKTRKENPDAVIDEIYEKVRRVIKHEFTEEQVNLIVGTNTHDGIGSLLTDLTTAEKKRVQFDFAQQQAKQNKKQVPVTQRLDKETIDQIRGRDEIVEGDAAVAGLDPSQAANRRYQFDIPAGMSRIQFLTSVEGVRLLDKASIPLGGYKSVHDRLVQALTTIRMFHGDDGLGLTAARVKNELKDPSTRLALMDAFDIVLNQIENNKRVIKNVSDDIMSSFTGIEFGAAAKLQDTDVPQIYKAFFRGDSEGGWSKIYDIGTDLAARTDISRQAISKFSPAQAFTEMIIRLRVRDEMIGLYDEMVRYGMPAARENYYIPETKLGPNGSKYSIDTPHKFHQRVVGHMRQIANKSGDVITYEMIPQEDGSSVRKVRRSRDPIPDYEFAPFEKRPDVEFTDIEAMIAAEEALVRFGKRTFNEGEKGFDTFTFAGGEEVFMPIAMKQEIDDAINRAGAIGQAFGTTSSAALRMDNVGAPMAPEIIQEKIPLQVLASNKVGRALNSLLRMFPMSGRLIKQGITTGFVIPILPYYVANFLGGAFQLSTAVGPIKSVSIMGSNPMFNASVVKRMFGRNQFTPPPNKLIISKTGQIYTVDQISDMALMYGLDSSFIQAETMTSMAEDIEQYLRKDQSKFRLRKVGDFARNWNNYLKEVATAIDNFYRVSIFTNELVEGKSPVQASALARKAAFDYGALTEFEKKYMRNTIMFYSYLRNNMNLFYDTLLTRPDRVLNQLRLANGIQQVNLETDPQVGMPRFLEGRLAVNFANALANVAQKDQRMYVMPPLPIMDSLNLVIDLYDGLGEDKEARRMLLTRIVPWFQAPLVAATDLDFFYGKNIDRFNRVSPFVVQMDLATGGFFRRSLEFENYVYRNPALRQVEGDDDRPITIAKNGLLYYGLRNLVQLPPFGRYGFLIDAADRADLGVVEGITEMTKEARISAEEMGLVEPISDEFTPGDTLSPRVGYTRFDEALALFGIKVYVTDTPTQSFEKLFDKLNRQYKSKLPRYSAGDVKAQALEKIIADPIDE